MPTTDTVISRLELVHPDLNHDGGAGLHTKIRNLYTRVGDMMNSRFFTADALANAASVDIDHNFKTAFAEMKVLLFLRDTGTGELTRINTTSSPPISQFTIAATPGFTTTQIRITNNSGSARDIAAVVVHGKGAEVLSDLTDIDFSTPPQSGQTLVYNQTSGKFEPGASGDASFKLQQIAANVLTLKGGYLQLDDGRELSTWNGSVFAADISVALLTVFAAPVDGTTYYLYIDINTLGSVQTQGLTGRKLYQITQSNLVLSTTAPESINRTRYVPLGTVKGAAGTTYDITNFTTIASRKADNGPVVVNPKVYSLSQAVGSVGSASQIQAGHLLASASFPSAMTASKASFFNLAADALDDSANGRNLTNNGSTAFTGSNIFGSSNAAANLDGTDDNFSSTDAHFNPGPGKSWACGGWFKAADWSPASTDFLISNLGTTSDRGLGIAVISDGSLQFLATNTAAAWDAAIPISPGFVDGSWHHIAMVYDFPTTTLKAFIDGKLVGSSSLANTRSVTSSIFRVGAEQSTPGSFFTGAVEDCFFVNDYLLTDADIRKLYASKITHNASVAAANQDWRFVLGSGVQKVPSLQPVVDQSDSNVLYADFSDLSATETVDMALLDLGMSPVVVPAVAPFDQTYNSNPSFPIAHGLSEVPSVQVGYKDASNDWHWTTGEGAVRADSTQLKGSIQTYFDAGATQVRIRAVVGASPTGVKQATASTLGVVKGGTLPGATDGAAIASGYVGERLTASLSNVTLTTSGVAYNLGSLVLPAGVWEVTGKIAVPGGSTSQVYLDVSLSLTSATHDSKYIVRDLSTTATTKHIAPVPRYINTTGTTVYLVGESGFTGTSPVSDSSVMILQAVRR